MDDRIYQIQPTETGDHILIYEFDGVDYVFTRKIFVDASEFRR